MQSDPSVQGSEQGFPVWFVNATAGAWSSDDIYIYALGADSDGRYYHLTSDGTMLPMDPKDADAPGHLTKNGVNYAAYGFPISQATAFRMPPNILGGRFYISVGSPLYIALAADGGFAGPDPLNPSDPNIDTVYGLFEFTWPDAFGCNTSNVNSFGLPFTARLIREWDQYDVTTGISMTREQVRNRFMTSVDPAFLPLQTETLILAPYVLFRRNVAQEGYLYQAIEDAWKYYELNPFAYTLGADVFSGNVIDGKLTFSVNGEGSYVIDKPTTYDVMAGANTMATGNDIELKLEAQLGAAFNRGVACDTSRWLEPSTYYPAGIASNDYAKLMHGVSLRGLAYAFGYDDVNDQSGVQILADPAHPPTSLTLSIGW